MELKFSANVWWKAGCFMFYFFYFRSPGVFAKQGAAGALMQAASVFLVMLPPVTRQM